MKRKAAVVALVLVALALLGLASAGASRSACELSTTRAMVDPKGGVVWVHLDPPDEGLAEVWKTSGAPHAIWEPPAGTPRWNAPPMPWRRLHHARIRGPFLVSVEYGWVRAPLIGGGGHAWYICLFGLTLHLGDAVTWQT